MVVVLIPSKKKNNNKKKQNCNFGADLEQRDTQLQIMCCIHKGMLFLQSDAHQTKQTESIKALEMGLSRLCFIWQRRVKCRFQM